MENLGIIGKPSDWLIASTVDYKNVKKVFNINLVDIAIDELIEIYQTKKGKVPEELLKTGFNSKELEKAYHIYEALKEIIIKYDLNGLTIRCFDLLGTIKSTSCLAFAMLNKEGIISACEGDVPALLSMYLVKKYLNKDSFQANPSKIDIQGNDILFAHCTLPLSMCNSFKLTTHYESGIGIGIKGELDTKEVTVFKINKDLNKYIMLKGKIIENLSLNNLCRTQIKIRLDDSSSVKYFLLTPLGNHHIIFYGKDTKELEDYLHKCELLQIK